MCSPGLQFSWLWSTCSTSCSEGVALQCKNVHKGRNNPVPEMEREGYCIFQISGQCRRCILRVSLHLYGSVYTFVREWNPTRSSTLQFIANTCFWGENLRVSKCQCIDFVPSFKKQTFRAPPGWGNWGFFLSRKDKIAWRSPSMEIFQYPRGSYWKAKEGLCIRNCSDSKTSNGYKLKGGNSGSSAEFNKTQKMY